MIFILYQAKIKTFLKKPAANGDVPAGALGTANIEAEYEQNLPSLSSFDISERGVEQLIDKANQRLTSTATDWEDRNKELRQDNLAIL